MVVRFREPAALHGWDWPVLVRCPTCGRRASVAERHESVRLVCTGCGLVRVWDGRTVTVADGEGRRITLSRGVTGDWIDPRTGRYRRGSIEWAHPWDECFGVDLWLVSECCGGHLLWARNATHLNYMRAFVAGELREDPNQPGPKPLSAKFPRWMKTSKHRDEVLRHLDRLAESLKT